MCIVCECGDRGVAFLTEFARAQHAMQKAARAMHTCAKEQRHYDRTHKQMVRLLREWNNIEHQREKGVQI